MLKIRLKRVGRKNDPSFRVVLLDSKKGPQTGKINEVLGFYDPRRDVKELKGDRIKEWVAKGAQVSDTVHNILVSEKIIEGKKVNVLPKKSPVAKKEKKVKEETPKEEVSKEKEIPKEETPVEEEKKEEKPQEEKPQEEAPKEE
jgi:small subunit ribosomal protein S16